jgi:hypothetical protein
MTPRERIEWLRTGPRAELVTLIAFVLALPLGTVHWLGLVAGGALVGLTAASTRRALVLGVFLGLFVVFGFLGWLWLAGVLGKAIATGQLLGASVAVAFVFPILGSAIRGLG